MKVKLQKKSFPKLFLLAFTVSSVLIILAGYFYYKQIEKNYKKEYSEHLATITELKAGEISIWRSERMSDASIIYKNPGFSSLVKNSLNEINSDKNRLLAWFEKIINAYQYDRICFHDITGQERFSQPDRDKHTHSGLLKREESLFKSDEITMTDLYHNEEEGKIYISILIQIHDEAAKERIGVVIIRIDPGKYLFPMISQWPVPNEEVETFLVRRDDDEVVFLNELRFRKNTALKLRFNINENKHLPSVQAVEGKTGIIEGIDYQGKPVIASINKIEGSQWFIIAKTDLAVIDEALNERLLTILLFVLLILVCAAALFAMGWKQIQYKYYAENYENLEKLRELSDRHEALLKSIPEIIMELNTDKIFIWANQAGIKFFGSEIIGKQFTDFAATANDISALENLFSGNDNNLFFEFSHRLTDGEERILDWSLRALKNVDGEVSGAIATARDVTEHRIAERNTIKINRIYAVLSNINQVIVRIHDLEELLTEACKIVVEDGKLVMAWFGIYETANNQLSPFTSFGNTGTYLENAPFSLNDESILQGPSGRAVFTGSHYICNDISSDPNILRWRDSALKHGFVSMASFPVIVSGKVFGILNLYSDENYFFDKDQIKLLDELAIDIAFAIEVIENDKLRQNIKEKLKERERELSTLIGNLNGIVYKCNNDHGWTMQFISSGVKEITGYEVSDFINNTKLSFNDIIHPEDRGYVFEEIQAAVKNREKFQLNYRIITASGKIKWVWEQGLGIFSADGSLTNLEGFITDVTDRRNTLEALRQSEYLFNTLARMSPVGIFRTKADGYTTYVNPKWCLLSGISAEEALGNGWFKAVHPDDREQLKKNWEVVTRKQEISVVEYRFLHPGGKTTWVMGQSVPEYSPERNLLGYIGTITDITERKTIEEALRASKEKYQNFIEKSSEGIYYVEYSNPINISEPIDIQIEKIISTGKIKECNNSFVKMYGFSSSKELIGMNLLELYGNEINDTNLEATKTFIKNGYRLENIETLEYDKEGNEKYFLNSVIAELRDGVLIGNWGLQTDITRIKESENRFRKLFENAPVAYQSLDKDGNIIEVNNIWLEEMHYKREDVLGKNISKFLCESSKELFRERFPQFIKPGKSSGLEFQFINRDGEIIIYSVEGRVGYDYQGNFMQTHCMLHNITERKKIEEELRISEITHRGIIDSVSDSIYIQDEHGRFLDVNKTAVETYGYSREFFIGKTPEFLSAPGRNDLSALKTAIEAALNGEIQRFEFWGLKKDGTIFPKEVSLAPGIYFEQRAVIAIARDITDRKQAERALKESESKFRNLVENISDVFYITDADGKLVYVSPNIASQTGYSIKEIIGKSYIRLIAKEDRRRVIDHYAQKAKSNDIDTTIEIRILKKDGSIVWTEQLSRMVRDNEGRIIQFRNLIRDITERKNAQEVIKRSESLFRSVWESSNDGMRLTDGEGKIIKVNQAFCELVNKPAEEIIGNPLDIFYRQPDNERVLESYINNYNKNSFSPFIEREFNLWNGEIKWFAVSTAVLGNIESSPLILSIFRDITERKISEKKILQLSRAIEQSPASVIITDPAGIIEYVNKKFTEVSGYSNEELIGQKTTILSSGYHGREFYENLWNTILSGRDWNGEIFNKKKSGELFWETVLISPLVNNDGDITHFVAVKEDITDKKKTQEELIRAKELAEQSEKLKSEFLAQMSHEIRTPIHIVTSNANYLRDELGDSIDPTIKSCFDSMRNASERIIRTIELILNMSEIQSGSYKPILRKIDLESDILLKIYMEYKLTASTKGLQLIYTNKAQNTDVKGDEYSLGQIFANLVDNAIKYTIKGSVEIYLENIGKNKVSVKIKDSGIGMSKKFQEHLFEPFSQEEQGYTRSFEGNGLGLALVKKYCEINDAEIQVSSKKNNGTTFTVIFETVKS